MSAKQLAVAALFPFDSEVFDHIEKIARREPREGRFYKVGIAADEIAGVDIQVGEIAAATARNENFASWRIVMLKHKHRVSELRRSGSTHQPRGSRSNHDHVGMKR